jgi:hypothetical protein
MAVETRALPTGIAIAFSGFAVAAGNQVNENVIINNPPAAMFYRTQIR